MEKKVGGNMVTVKADSVVTFSAGKIYGRLRRFMEDERFEMQITVPGGLSEDEMFHIPAETINCALTKGDLMRIKNAIERIFKSPEELRRGREEMRKRRGSK